MRVFKSQYLNSWTKSKQKRLGVCNSDKCSIGDTETEYKICYLEFLQQCKIVETKTVT